jgi:hypothetical protein
MPLVASGTGLLTQLKTNAIVLLADIPLAFYLRVFSSVKIASIWVARGFDCLISPSLFSLDSDSFEHELAVQAAFSKEAEYAPSATSHGTVSERTGSGLFRRVPA